MREGVQRGGLSGCIAQKFSKPRSRLFTALARREEIAPAMRQRILKVLALGVLQKHDATVLGAPGYGVFGNDTNETPVSFNASYTILSAPTVGRYLRFSIGQREKG